MVLTKTVKYVLIFHMIGKTHQWSGDGEEGKDGTFKFLHLKF